MKLKFQDGIFGLSVRKGDEYLSKTFYLQIPDDIIRSEKLDALEFVLYAKLVQYYNYMGRKSEYELSHKALMRFLQISENKRFKEAFNTLVTNGLLLQGIDELPRKKPIVIKINTDHIISKEKEGRRFTQLPADTLDFFMLEAIGYIGCRILFYLESYIDRTSSKEFAHPSEKTIAEDLGIDPKTVIKYIKILRDKGIVKVTSSQLEPTYEYERVKDKEVLLYHRYCNKYFINRDKIVSFVNKKEAAIKSL